MLASIVALLLSAFVTGGLARFAVPGPDPMPAWLTVLIGLVGSLIGWGIVVAVAGPKAAWVGIAGFLCAIVLVIAYRRFVQKRPLFGPEAYRFPERGLGVKEYRQRLQQAGIDPNRIGSPFGAPPNPEASGLAVAAAAARDAEPDDPTENPAHFLGLLEELHDSGVLSDEEYAAAKTRLLESAALTGVELGRAAGESPLCGERPVALPPDVRRDGERVVRDLVDVEAARLADAARARLSEAGRDREHRRVRGGVADDLELAPLRDRGLVDVAAEDQLGARRGERASTCVAVGERELARRPPRGAEEMVVEDDDAARTVRGRAEPLDCAAQLIRRQRAALVPERPRRVQPDDVQRGGGVRRLGRLPYALELLPRAREPRRERVRKIVVPRHRQHRRAERDEEAVGAVVLLRPAAMREVAGGDDELRPQPRDERRERRLDLRILLLPHVEIRYMDEGRGHDRWRL